MKLLWVAAPILLLAIVLAGRWIAGKPVTRHGANVVIALVLLVYLVITGGLGVFWVARMDLPAFDLHYLFGYCVLALAAVHLSFQLRILGAFFRRAAPRRLLTEDGKRFRRGAKLGAAALTAAAVVAPAAWLYRGGSMREVVRAEIPEAPAVASSARSPAPLTAAPRIFVESATGRVSAIDYLHRESGHSRREILQRPGASVAERPGPFKELRGLPRAALGAPAGRAGVSLAEAIDARYERRLPEDAPGAERIVVEPARDAMTRRDLATLLHYTNGITSGRGSAGGVLLRAAASAGALHPVDVYVLARRVEGLAPGVYYHHAEEDALVRIAGPDAFDRIARASSTRAALESAPVAFALGVTFDRTVWKYDTRSYRYLALDTGHALGNLSLAAVAMRRRCFVDPYFDDAAVEAALGMDRGEGALAVVGCRGPGATNELPVSRTTLPAHAPIALPERADEAELTDLSHRMTSWRLLDGPALAYPAPAEVAPDRPGPALSEAPPRAEIDLFRAIARRRSFREFSAKAVSVEHLAGLLEDARVKLPELGPGAEPEVRVIARAVESIAPGIYEYSPSSRSVKLLRGGDFSSEIRAAGLSQELLARAAFVIVWSLPEAVFEAPPREYRTANLLVGMGGQTAYLSAVARGLGICGVGAFYDDEVTELIGRGGRAVYLMGVGHR